MPQQSQKAGDDPGKSFNSVNELNQVLLNFLVMYILAWVTDNRKCCHTAADCRAESFSEAQKECYTCFVACFAVYSAPNQQHRSCQYSPTASQQSAINVHQHTHMDTTPNIQKAAAPLDLVTDFFHVKNFQIQILCCQREIPANSPPAI